MNRFSILDGYIDDHCMKNPLLQPFFVQNCFFLRGTPNFGYAKYIKNVSTAQCIFVKSFIIGSFDRLYFDKAKTI